MAFHPEEQERVSKRWGSEREESFRLLRSCQIHVTLLSRLQTLDVILNLRNWWTSRNQPSHVKNRISWVLRGCRTAWGNLRQSSPGETSSVTSCESKGAWRCRTPPLAAGRWWSPPALRGTPLSAPATLGRCRSRIPASRSPAATQTGTWHWGLLSVPAPCRVLTLAWARAAFRNPSREARLGRCRIWLSRLFGGGRVLTSLVMEVPFMQNRFGQELSNYRILTLPAATGSEFGVAGALNCSHQILVNVWIRSLGTGDGPAPGSQVDWRGERQGLAQGLPGRGPGQWGAGRQTFAAMCPTASSSGWALPPSLLQLLTLNCGHHELY